MHGQLFPDIIEYEITLSLVNVMINLRAGSTKSERSRAFDEK